MKMSVLIASVMGAGLLVVAASAQEGRKEEVSGKVKALQQERLAVLEQLADATNRLFRNARTGPDEAYDSKLLLMTEQVNAAETAADRVKIYETFVNVMRNFESMAAAQKASAQGTQAAILKAKAMRLEGEIGMEQARAGSEKEAGATKANELRRERIAALKELADVASALYRNARTTANVAYDASWNLTKAEAEDTENESDRIKLYEKLVDVMKGYETIAETHKAGAQGSQAAVLKAKAMRLEAEIIVLRAKAAVEKDGAEKDEKVNGIKELRQARIAALKELAEVTKTLYRNARTTADEAFEAELALLRAEAEAADNPPDRITLYEKFVEVMKAFEEMAEAKKAGARGTQAAVLKAKSIRLKGEIALEQAKAKATK